MLTKKSVGILLLIVAIPTAFLLGVRYQGQQQSTVPTQNSSEPPAISKPAQAAECRDGMAHAEVGNRIQQDRIIHNFSRLAAASNVTVVLERGDVPQATVTADQAIAPCVELRQQGDSLAIGLRSGQYNISAPIVVRVVTSIPLSHIDSSGQSRVSSGNLVATSALQLTASGQSAIDLTTVELPAASWIEASGQSHIRALVGQVGQIQASGQSEIVLPKSKSITKLVASGQAQVTLSGNTPVANLDVSGQASVER